MASRKHSTLKTMTSIALLSACIQGSINDLASDIILYRGFTQVCVTVPWSPLAFAFAVLSVGCPCCEDDKKISKQANNDYSFILRVTNVNDLITTLGLVSKNETFVTVTCTNNFGNKNVFCSLEYYLISFTSAFDSRHAILVPSTLQNED